MEETEHGRRLAVAGRHDTSHRERRRAMNEEERIVFTDKGARSIKAGFALIACSGLIMAAATIAPLYTDVGGAWWAAVNVGYLAAGTAGILLIGRAFATSKSVLVADETASDITERESK